MVGLIVWTLWGNTALEVSEYKIVSGRIPQSFSGFRIAQISDLHNAEFGPDNGRLLELLAQTAPDIIVITGDLIDSRRTDLKVALDFCKAAMELAPVYYVSGNNEAKTEEYTALKDGMKEAGVCILDNKKIAITREGEHITLIGLDDPNFRESYRLGDPVPVATLALAELYDAQDGYTVLLSHRPELFSVYAHFQVNLIFSGHTHGGQFRLPFIGGLIAPNQGLFPKYDAGVFTEGRTNMLVSRGLGNSAIPLRLNNRPEIVVAELRSAAQP